MCSPINELTPLHVLRKLICAFTVQGIQFFLVILLLGLFTHGIVSRFASWASCPFLLQSLFIEFIIYFSFGLLECYDILFIFDPNKRFFKPLSILFYFPLLFKIELINLFILFIVANAKVCVISMEDDILFLH